MRCQRGAGNFLLRTDLPCLVCDRATGRLLTDVLNTGSRAVAARCGFHLEGVLRHHMRGPQGELRDTCLYGRLAPQVGPSPADPPPV